MDVPAHLLPLRLSMLVQYLMQHLILPAKYQFIEGLGYSEVLMKMLGGNQCTGVQDCCAALTAQMIQDDPVTEGLLKNGCQSLVYAYADHLSYLFERDEKDMDTMGRVLEFSLEDCSLLNNDDDKYVDFWGGETTPCTLDIQYHYKNEIVEGSGTLHGERP